MHRSNDIILKEIMIYRGSRATQYIQYQKQFIPFSQPSLIINLKIDRIFIVGYT